MRERCKRSQCPFVNGRGRSRLELNPDFLIALPAGFPPTLLLVGPNRGITFLLLRLLGVLMCYVGRFAEVMMKLRTV